MKVNAVSVPMYSRYRQSDVSTYRCCLARQYQQLHLMHKHILNGKGTDGRKTKQTLTIWKVCGTVATHTKDCRNVKPI